MSAVKIKIRPANTASIFAVVYVDGKFAYQTPNHPKHEGENIKALLNLLVVENVEVEVFDR